MSVRIGCLTATLGLYCTCCLDWDDDQELLLLCHHPLEEAVVYAVPRNLGCMLLKLHQW